MQVDVARDILLGRKREASDPFHNSQLTLDIWTWWNALKDWEAQDTFLDAFYDKRLCITQRPDGDKTYDMEAKKTVATEKVKFPGAKYAVGVNSLTARLQPSNYSGIDDQGMKRKYALGLLDLSASLLNPLYPTIKGQLRWTIESQNATWPVVFIPLPKPEDVEAYNLVNAYVRASGDPILLQIMKFIRHRMTRPKLAAAVDMGAGPYAWNKDDDGAQKFKYGYKSNDGVATKETLARAKTAATNYQSIIENAKAILGRGDVKVVASNELTIALRQMSSKRFPVITRFDGDGNRFVFSQPNPFFPAGYIPDAWKNTQETRTV